jgi:hypothetical protein
MSEGTGLGQESKCYIYDTEKEIVIFNENESSPSIIESLYDGIAEFIDSDVRLLEGVDIKV